MSLKFIISVLSAFYISSCTTRNLPLYTTADHEQPNFKATPVSSNFYAVGSNNEKLLISIYEKTFYKFNEQGALIDTLDLSDSVPFYVQPENYFIYIEDGYFPNWINTGDKTKKKYAQFINADLKMDTAAIKHFKEVIDDDKFSTVQERNEFLDKQEEKFQLLKLLKPYKEKSQYASNGFFLSRKYEDSREYADFFVINDEVIKVRVSLHLAYFNEKIVKQPREKLSATFQEKIKPFHFEKTEWVKRKWSIFSGISDGYWIGNAYYNIPVGHAIYKLKLENLDSDDNDNEIQISRAIFPNNQYFILIRTPAGRNYFIQELLGKTK